jgi:transposase
VILTFVTVLAPHLAGLAIEGVVTSGRSVHVLARTCAREVACPGCGVMSRRVHSRYQRKLADTASGGQEVLIRLGARRFFCSNGACAKATFAEQVPGLTTRYGRRTCSLQVVLQVVLQAVGLALGGRAGARLTGRLACTASRSTLLRLIRAMPDPESGTPLILGVDDFALRKGHVYGTIMVDIETRRPVDMVRGLNGSVNGCGCIC